jgi:hypothetical protein
MLNTLVAVVLGNAVVASLFALGVVLLARWYHKPALLHGLWVVVLLKLITPPMFTIPVPVQMSGLVPLEQNSEAKPVDAFPDPQPTAFPTILRVPLKQSRNVTPDPTIVIEAASEPELELPGGKIGEQDPLAIFPAETLSGDEAGNVSAEEISMESIPREAESFAATSVGFPGTTPIEKFPVPAELPSARAYSWRSLLWPVMLIWGAGIVVVFLSAWQQILRFERSISHPIHGRRARKIAMRFSSNQAETEQS